jgi:hypothetical protein
VNPRTFQTALVFGLEREGRGGKSERKEKTA